MHLRNFYIQFYNKRFRYGHSVGFFSELYDLLIRENGRFHHAPHDMILIVVTGQLGGSEVFVRNRPNEPLGSNPNGYPEEINRCHRHPIVMGSFNVTYLFLK